MVERVLMSDHFWLDLVVLVLSTFVFSVLFGVSQTRKKKRKKNNGLKYRVAAQLKISFTFSQKMLLYSSLGRPWLAK